MESGQDFLTKEALLQGNQAREVIQLTDGPVQVRPLTEAEKGKVEALGMRGLKAQVKGGELDGINMEMEMLTLNDYEAGYIIIAAGLSVSKEQRVQPVEVKNATFKKGDKEALIAGILKLSGMDAGVLEMMQAFRKGAVGKGTGADDPVGDAIN